MDEYPPNVVAAAQTIPAPRDVDYNLADHLRLAEAAASQGARLVVFPELSLTGYDRTLTIDQAVDPLDRRFDPLKHLADDNDLVIVVGAPVSTRRGLHIAAVAFRPGASPVVYHKQHLHDGEEVAFVPGLKSCGFPLGRDAVGLAICADIRHPEHVATAVTSGSSIYAAGCFITPEGYDTDARVLRQYAITHHLTVLMANFGAPVSDWSSAGRSAIWSTEGELLASAPADGEALIFAEDVGHS